MPDASAEAAVRRYLLWLEDPSSIVDADAVARAEGAVAAAGDPMTRLHALADLEHARQADASGVRSDFVARAKAYADGQSIPVTAFQASGVPDDVLREAGFEAMGRRRSSGGRRSLAGGRSRAPKVPVDELKAATLRLPKQFTLADVATEAGGGSPQTVRRAVDELIEAGKARRLGPKPDHSGRGRAPTLYELA